MKTLISIIVSFFILPVLYGQTLENTYSATPSYWRINADDGVYVVSNNTTGAVEFFNDSHGSLQSNSFSNLVQISYPSDKLVDNDNGIEFIVAVNNNNVIEYTLRDDDGSIILGPSSGMYIFQSGTGAKLRSENSIYSLNGDYFNSFNEQEDNTTIGIDNGSTAQLLPAYPNPAVNNVNIPYNAGYLQIYNTNGQLLNRYHFTTSGVLQYSTPTQAGTYFYKNNGLQAGSFVVQ